jgi:F-type H+-transporting ATPase subunit epsilon
MAMTFHCDIVSAEDSIFSGLVELLVANCAEGEVGVCYGHAPLLTSLKPGPIRLKKQNGDEDIYYIGSGFLEIQPHAVTVLADTAMRAGDMDEAKALEAKKQAEQALTNQSGEIDYYRAALQLAEAAAQLRTLQAIRKNSGK